MQTYMWFAGVGFLTAGSVAGLGYFPTVHYAGREAIGSMLAGCGVSLAASLVGAVPVARAVSGGSAQPVISILASTAFRFITVLALLAPLALSGWLDRTVFVLWAGISYVLMLFVDTWLSLWVIKSGSQDGS